MAGVSRLQYTTEMRIIRVMCTGRIDPSHIMRAFSNGMDGVYIAGCRLGECNYTTHGNHHAFRLVLLFKKILEQAGLSPERLRLDFMSGSEANLFIEGVNSFVRKVKELGPLGQSEGIDKEGLGLKLKAITKLIPYIRVVDNERLGVHFDTQEEYKEFYSGEELDGLFNELIANKLLLSQVMLLLHEKPLSTAEISKILGLAQPEIFRHLNIFARQGLIKYEESQKHFALA